MPPIRRLLPLLPLGAALAVAPATAAAKEYTVHATARGSHGFAVRLHAGVVTDFGGQPVSLDPGSVVVSRTSRGQTISRTLESGQGLKVRAARGLRRARVRLSFGTRGRVALRFRPRGAMHKAGSDSCGSTLRGRRGVFRGTFRVRMGGVFHTLHRVRLRGTLAAEGSGDADCTDPSPIGGDDNLTVSGPGFSAIFYHVDQPQHGPPTSVGIVSRPSPATKAWTQSDEIEVHRAGVFGDSGSAGTPPFTESAHVRAGGPFLTGSLDYGPVSGITPSPENTWSAPGPVTGSLTARFDRLGGAAATISPTTGTLTSECEQCI